MPLLSLGLQNFRRFERAGLKFHPQRNVIYGGNAVGKSTILEAIQFLSTGKSLRTKSLDKLVRYGTSDMTVRGITVTPGHDHSIFMQFRGGGRVVGLDGSPGAKLSEVARTLPTLLISPESHYEFQRDSRQRRASMDWVLFHVEQTYQNIWSRYQRVLLQRNAALKHYPTPRSIAVWNEELALHGDSIHELRLDIIAKLNDLFGKCCAQLVPSLGVAELAIKAGWESEKGLNACLLADFDRDSRHGYTQSGPHRSDLTFVFKEMKEYTALSHGQKKLIFVALAVAQVEFLSKNCSVECSLLIDDLSAELDKNNLAMVMRLLSGHAGQIIVTSLEQNSWTKNWQEFKSFHVKHSEIVYQT